MIIIIIIIKLLNIYFKLKNLFLLKNYNFLKILL